MHLEHFALIVEDYDARDEPYGKVVVFVDVSGNRWDLLGPAK